MKKLIKSYGLPVDFSALSRKLAAADLIDTMRIDKKVEGGKVKFVLPKKMGEVVVTREWEEGMLREVLEKP